MKTAQTRKENRTGHGIKVQQRSTKITNNIRLRFPLHTHTQYKRKLSIGHFKNKKQLWGQQSHSQVKDRSHSRNQFKKGRTKRASIETHPQPARCLSVGVGDGIGGLTLRLVLLLGLRLMREAAAVPIRAVSLGKVPARGLGTGSGRLAAVREAASVPKSALTLLIELVARAGGAVRAIASVAVKSATSGLLVTVREAARIAIFARSVGFELMALTSRSGATERATGAARLGPEAIRVSIPASESVSRVGGIARSMVKTARRTEFARTRLLKRITRVAGHSV